MPMNKAESSYDKPFRFCTRRGQFLTEQITEIETLATERLRAGVAYHSVHTGALALLRLALQDVNGALPDQKDAATQIPACTPAPKQSRCPAPKG